MVKDQKTADRFLFVTGGTGKTGSRLIRRLLHDGWDVRALVRTDEHRRFLPQDERLTILRGDLTDPAKSPAWAESLKGADAVLHLAHTGFAEKIVRACQSVGVGRLICLSSTRRFTKFPEQTAKMVIEGEASVEASGLNWTILRSSMIYGGGRDNNVEKLSRWLRGCRFMPLVRGGKNLVQPIFVDDLAEALVRALARPTETSRTALTVAGPEPITWKRMVQNVGEKIGRPPIWIPVPYGLLFSAAALAEFLPGRPPATRDQIRRLLEDKTFDIAESVSVLGDWHPRKFAG